jgi:hypothetical protein
MTSDWLTQHFYPNIFNLNGAHLNLILATIASVYAHSHRI